MNPHQTPKTSLRELFASFARSRKLIFKMAKREVLGRYRGSMFGLAWSFFNPLLMLMIYTIFFSIVLKNRWGVSQEAGHANFAVVLFVGLIIHGLFAECINRAPALITNNVSYVKKVVFPLEVFPWIAMGTALFHAAISVSVLLLLQLALAGALPWTATMFPLVLLPLLILTMGVAWFLAATGVYVRDIGQITGMISSILLFLSPIFFPLSSLSQELQKVALINPLTLIIENSRQVLLFGQQPDWTGLGIYSVCAISVAWAGFWWFQKMRKGFADVL